MEFVFKKLISNLLHFLFLDLFYMLIFVKESSKCFEKNFYVLKCNQLPWNERLHFELTFQFFKNFVLEISY